MSVHAFDQTDAASCAALMALFEETPLDVVINNAAAGGSGLTRGDVSGSSNSLPHPDVLLPTWS